MIFRNIWLKIPVTAIIKKVGLLIIQLLLYDFTKYELQLSVLQHLALIEKYCESIIDEVHDELAHN